MRSACALLVIAGSAVFAAPAGAGFCAPQPGHADAQIRFGPSYVGDDVFNTTGETQRAVFLSNGLPPPGFKGTWRIRVENERPNPKTVRVAAFPIGDADAFKVRFFRNDNNVTDKVLGPGVKFRNVAPGARTKVLKLEMATRQGTDVGDEIDNRIAGFYPSSCAQDIVAAVYSIQP